MAKNYKINRLQAFFLFLFLFMCCVSPVLLKADDKLPAQGLTGHDIMQKVYQRPDGEDRTSTWQMILVDKKGRQRVREAVFYSKDDGQDTKTLIYFWKPADIKGTGFLSYEYDNPKKQDDRWLYLPALKKVRRISGTSNDDYFMGTDFTYNDMGKRPVNEDTHRLLREEEKHGHKCWVIESIPGDKDYLYSKTISWIRQDSFCKARVEYFDRRGSLLKILTVPDQEKQDGFWTAFKMVMDNTQKNHKTILELKEITYNQGIKDSLFRVSTLERGRI